MLCFNKYGFLANVALVIPMIIKFVAKTGPFGQLPHLPVCICAASGKDGHSWTGWQRVRFRPSPNKARNIRRFDSMNRGRAVHVLFPHKMRAEQSCHQVHDVVAIGFSAIF